MTSLRGNLNSVDLANIFQMLSMNHREGTLYVFDKHGRKAIYFGAEGASMLSRGRHRPDSIGRILIRNDKLTLPQLQEALRQQRDSSGRLLGQVLVEQGLVSRADVEDALRTQIEEEVYSLFIWKDAQFEFVEGPPDEEFRGNDGVARLTFSVNGVIMEAAKRVDEWEWIQRVLPNPGEILRYTGRNVDLDEEIFAQGYAGKVLAAVDGKRSVDEIIDQSCVNRFEVTKMLALLLEAGAVEPLPAPELRREAQEALAGGDADAGAKFLTRLVALKGDTPEMHRQLAEVLEGKRQLEKAAFHYKVHAEVLAGVGERKPAFESYRRIQAFLPTDIGALDRLIDIYVSGPDGLEQHATEVVEKAKLLAGVYGDLGRRSRAIQVLHRVVPLAPDDSDLRNRLIEVYLAGGMTGEAIAEYDAMAETALAVHDVETAEKIYRKILQIDRGRDDAQVKLNQILNRRRSRTRGVRLAVAGSFLLAAIAFGAWRGFEYWSERQTALAAEVAAFNTGLSGLRVEQQPLLDDLQAANGELTRSFRTPEDMAQAVRLGAARKQDLVARTNAATQALHALAARFPAVQDVEQSRTAAQTLERAVAQLTEQEEKLRLALHRRVDDLFEEMVPWPPALPLVEIDAKLARINSLSESISDWQSGERGQLALAYGRNVRDVLEAFDAMQADVDAKLGSGDAPGAQERVLEYLSRYLPPADVVGRIEMPRTIASRPSGARILVDGKETGLLTPAVLRLPLDRASAIQLVRTGFEPTTVQIPAISAIDRARTRDGLGLTVDEVLRKDLAFRTPAVTGKIGAAPTVAGERIIVPARGGDAGVFDLSGVARQGFPARGSQVRAVVIGDVAVFASADGSLLPFRISTGDALARQFLPARVSADPVAWGDLAIFADVEGRVTAYDAHRGVRAWTWPASGRGRDAGFLVSPTVAGDAIWAVAANGLVVVLDAASGKELRSGFLQEGAAPALPVAPLAVSDGRVFAVARGDRGQSRVICADAETFQVRSAFGLDGTVRHAPLLGPASVCVVTDDGDVTAIRLEGDALRSAQSLRLGPGVRIQVEPVAVDGVVYVGDTLGSLWALDISGDKPERLFDFRIPGTDRRPVAIVTRAVVTDTHVIFGAGDNVVYGIRK